MKHLNDNKVGYCEHFTFAMKISIDLLKISICLAIHALYPEIFCDTASRKIKELNDILNCR